MSWDLKRDLEIIRKEFPILEQCVYLISNSLGAAPKRAAEHLKRFYSLWAEDGVSAWEKEWWNLSRKVGNQIASLLGAKEDEVTMQVNATLCHWIILSTQFNPGSKKDDKKNKIVMTDHDFPSVIYAVSKIAEVMGWTVELLNSQGEPGMDAEKIINAIDDSTLFVATSHVYFKSAYIQDIQRIAARAREAGALSLIDGYHAPGTIPVDVKKLGVDFYVGGCLKWLCGGPGNAFLYVRPELAERLQPYLTGWFAHKEPFLFAQDMEFTQDSYRFMSGTPPVPSLYTAQAGLEIIKDIGIHRIREKSLVLTGLILKKAKEKRFHLYTPEEENRRGGAVSFGLPHALAVKLALEQRGIKVDFRKGEGKEPDIIRAGPHFYSKTEEVEILFQEIEAIYSSGEYKKYKDDIRHVT
jgi:kynureninase